MKSFTTDKLKAEVEELNNKLRDAGKSMTNLNEEISHLETVKYKREEIIKYLLWYFLEERGIEIPEVDLDKFYLEAIINEYGPKEGE